MRLKAIPDEAISAVKSHPYMAGAAAIAIIGGYLYLHNLAAPVQASSDNSNSLFGLGYSAPTAYPISADTSGGGGGPSSVASYDPNAVTDRDLFDFEKLKEQDSYDIQMATLQYNANVSIANATLGLAGIQSSNFIAATQLAQSIVGTQATSLTGAIFGPNGQLLLAYGNAQTLTTTSKNGKTIAANAAANAAGQSAFNNWLAQIGSLNGVFSTPSGSNTTASSGTYSSPDAGSISSIASATVNAAYSDGGSTQTVADAQSSTIVANNASNGPSSQQLSQS